MNLEVPDDAIRKAISEALMRDGYDNPLGNMAKAAVAQYARKLEMLIAAQFQQLLDSPQLASAIEVAFREAVAENVKAEAVRAVKARARRAADAADMFGDSK